ncbi:acyl-CoA N-acyltransferase [Microdochium trichocladiopsis]|uniref:Acyl-CoA N-acyltransferase n=1 Tax=Microdochium trichocladiopsis TaxID=1682393 RepID=A0A9P9BQ09_9PEZI|nr:acyl-CoA N-acyltransferase [Microdochium trichocladiopsis]KAH7025061.1 acyl-CoA N-acyltransferase [Microdochium trichocladiopsis]
MTYTIELAAADDAEGIARVMLNTTESEFSRLQRGTMGDEDSQARMATRLQSVIASPEQHVVVARVQETGEIASAAVWAIKEEEAVPSADERARKIEERRQAFDPRMNVEYIVELMQKLGDLEHSLVQGRKHWLLDNLATLPEHRRQGLAGKLVEWPLEMADREGILCFLTTADGGGGESLYKKYGFERVGAAEFDLAKYGGSGPHTHIAMLREAKRNA